MIGRTVAGRLYKSDSEIPIPKSRFRSMSTAIDHRLSDVRRRVRQVLATYGASWLAAAVVGSVLLVCLADWLVHFDDPVVRLIFLLGIVGGAVWVVRRHLVAPFSVHLTDTDLALRIEDRYPGFQDSLASSVEFLRADNDPRIGSPALQQAVVRKTLDRLAVLDCGDVVDAREARRLAWLAVGVCLAALVIAGLNRPLTAIALQRLVLPFSAPAWPRQVNLRLLNADLTPLEYDADRPLHIARGDTFRVFAENTSGHLPSRVTLEYRFSGQKVVAEAMRPTTAADGQAQRREVAVGQLLSVRGEVEFRAVGGDDDQMPWYRLMVVPPPAVEKLQVTLVPPGYLHRDQERQPEGVGHVQGLVGTRVEIDALANKPVERAVLRVKDQERHRIEPADGGRRLQASFLIAEAGLHSWWLELKDAQGFEDAEPPRYEIRGLQDFEPEIYIEQPAADMQVTAEAVVPLRTVAKDDLGLVEIRLVYKIEGAGSDNPEQVISLFRAESALPQTQAAVLSWKIGELHPPAGGRIVYHTEATDRFDLSAEFPEGKAPPPHVGRSVTRTLTIVTPEDKSQEIAQRQEGLLGDLERSFKLQEQAHDQVDELLVQIDNAGKLRSEDVDALKRTELGQREIASQLGNPATGLEKRARELADELRNNQINDAQAERRLNRIADELARLVRENLGPIEEELTQARKLVQSGAPAAQPAGRPDGDKAKPGGKSDPQSATGKKAASAPAGKSEAGDDERSASKSDDTPQSGSPGSDTSGKGSPPSAREKPAGDRPSRAGSARPGKAIGERPDDALRRASENQEAVLESLGEMLQDLSQWRGEHDASRELGDLVRQQAELNQRSAELARQTLTRTAEALTPQEQADLAKIAERQKKQADQLEQLQAKMRGTIEDLAQENPSAAATLKEAAQQAEQEGIAGQMRDAAGQIGENRMGQAARMQQDVLRKLRDLEDTLRQKGESDTELLVKKLKAAAGDLQELRDRQAELLHKTERAEQNPDPAERAEQLRELRKEQEKLQEETARMARRLARLEAGKPQASAERAASRMQEAQDRLDQQDQAGAGEQQQEALDDLEQAQRELARRQREEEEQLAREQLARVADELQGIIPRQQSVIDETRRLDELHAKTGKWSRAQLVSLRDLTTAQRTLSEDVGRTVEKLSAAEVFALALKGAVRNMQRAADQLAERATGAPTQSIQEAARRRVVDLVDALKPDEPDSNQNPPPEQAGGGSGGQQGHPPADGIPTLAQVKMLITLQKELIARTAEIEKLRGKDGRLPLAAHEELEAIAREQGDLADLTRNLSAVSSPPEDEGNADQKAESDQKPE